MTQTRRDFRERAFLLSQEVFNLYPRLAGVSPAHGHLAHQLLRATTAIGALLEEGAIASSRRDMANKYSLAPREAREADYWARLGSTDARWRQELASIVQETHEFIAMLTAAVRKLRAPIQAV
jgi:four helix bundle protein